MATPNLSTPLDRVAFYVQNYNQAIAAQDDAGAVKWGTMAMKEATEMLANPGTTPDFRQQARDTILNILEYLRGRAATGRPMAASVTGPAPEEEDAIHSTDWFSDPPEGYGLDNIAGLENLKKEFLLNIFAPTTEGASDIYRRYRGEQRGLQVLLYGPPGTGKTHAVRCLAGEMKCKIAIVQIKDVMANLVGDGAKIIAEIFEQAKQYERCIIFFDEIDAIASSREGDDSRHTKEQLTTLLTNMDGFTSKAAPGQIRVVIAATNRPWALDSAVKRGGRFDTQIYVPMPDIPARAKLIETFLKDVPRAQDLTTDWLVERTEGYAAADIMSICRQATSKPMDREITSFLRGAYQPDCVTRADFEVIFGNYINPTTDEALMQFDAYRQNREYDADFVKWKCAQIIRCLTNTDAAGVRVPLASSGVNPFELRWLGTHYKSGYLRRAFDYDVTYMIQLDALMRDCDFNDEFIRKKCDELITKLYLRTPIPEHEKEWFRSLYASGYVTSAFGTVYDLSFLPSRIQL